MASPTSITESAAKALAHATLGNFAAILEWTIEGDSYDEIVDDAVAEFGEDVITDVAGIKNVQLLKACVRFVLWREVTSATNVQFNLSDSGDSLSLSQLNDHARKSAKEWLSEINRLRIDASLEADGLSAGALVASMTEITRSDDPYEEEEASSEYSA